MIKNHQADNLAKLTNNINGKRKMIAKIFCAIRKLKIERIKEKHGEFRAFRKNAMIFS